VVRFAQTHGFRVVGTSSNRMNVDITGPVASVEAAFHVTMRIYRHPTEDRTFYSPDREPTADLAFALWRIAGLDDYSIPRPALVRRPAGVMPQAMTGSCPETAFCGSDMRAAYYEGTALTGAGQSLGLLEYAGTDLADLATYYKNAGQTNSVPITLLSTDGTSTSCLESQGCDDTEQTLDMTQALGMAPGLSHLVLYIGSTDAALLNGMATGTPLCAQLSSSWSWSPPDPATDNPYFEEFAAQGQNFFEAAGDDGEWNSRAEIWPADDQYVTAVGGTVLTTAGPGGPWASETAWDSGGGGISPDKIAIPSWQTATAAGCSDCSQIYRNGPDVAANAGFSFYVCADQTACTSNLYGGTSFAAPMWAGYLALANEQQAANGGAPLGFVNPAFYSIGLGPYYLTDFHDITSGSNGSPATPGYDLATGWGSPNASGLIDGLTGLQSYFDINSSPRSLSVDRGSSGTTTITTTIAGKFDAAIALSASGEGSGVSVTFKPSSIAAPGAGTSKMTVKVGKAAALGKRTITVTGNGGGLKWTATVTLDVLN
jgi:kumamolisin